MSSRNSHKIECEAVLFDLDGVLVDSTRAVERAWKNWASRHGFDANRVLEAAHGRRTADTIRAVAPHLSAEDEARALEKREAEDTSGVFPVPGAAEFLAAIPAGRWAIVTSGSRMIATSRLRFVNLPVPDVFICAGDITRGKPDPGGYLKAAGLLGIEPENCVVVEDAPAGIEAARAAGMRAIGVASTHPASELSAANFCVEALNRLDLVLPDGEAHMKLVIESPI